MPETTGNVSYGIVVAFTPEGGAENFAGEMTDISKDSESTDQVDMTHQQSDDQYREFLPGLTDPGTVTIALNHDPDKNTPDNGQRGDLQITLPAAWGVTLDQMTCKANVATAKAMDAPLGDKVSSEISFKLSGKPVWADSTP